MHIATFRQCVIRMEVIPAKPGQCLHLNLIMDLAGNAAAHLLDDALLSEKPTSAILSMSAEARFRLHFLSRLIDPAIRISLLPTPIKQLAEEKRRVHTATDRDK